MDLLNGQDNQSILPTNVADSNFEGGNLSVMRTPLAYPYLLWGRCLLDKSENSAEGAESGSADCPDYESTLACHCMEKRWACSKEYFVRCERFRLAAGASKEEATRMEEMSGQFELL